MSSIINFAKRVIGAKTVSQNLDAIFKFRGGVHPPEHKSESTQRPISQLAIPDKLLLPLRQHAADMPTLIVQVGAHVLKGQLLAKPDSAASTAIHAPTSATVTAISTQLVPHPSGLADVCITLIPDGKDTWTELVAQDWLSCDKQQLLASLRLSGIAGLDAAIFAPHIQLHDDGRARLHTVLINAAESEPYISCDDMLMRERADEIVQGIAIVQYLLDAAPCIIAIEDSKPAAVKAMSAACAGWVSSIHSELAVPPSICVKVVPTLYPSDNERLLIKRLLGSEIPSGKLATDMGITVFNVTTVLAIYRYFKFGEPAISRIVTMTGNVASPGNFEVLFGTPLMALVTAAGGAKADTTHYIMGGAMTGLALASSELPITQAANCIIAAAAALLTPAPLAMPCIRCGRCADACPMHLQPQQLYKLTQSDDFSSARDYHLFDCIECGCCSYVCPSHIPLVQYFRYGKSAIIAADQAQAAADLARERYEFRLARIAREKLELAQKHVQRTQRAKTTVDVALTPASTAKLPAKLETSHAAAEQVSATDQATAKAKLKRQALIAEAFARVQAQKSAADTASKLVK